VQRSSDVSVAPASKKSLSGLILVGAALTGFNARVTPAFQLYDFDSMASAAAGAIESHSRGSAHQKILVTDFEETNGATSQLGEALAESFADALRNHVKNFDVIDHRDVANAIANHELPEGVFSSAGIEVCYASKFGATMIVKAGFKYAPDGLVFDLHIFVRAGEKGIFGDKTIIPLTPAMGSMKSLPKAVVPDSFGDDKTVWTRDPNAPSQQILPAPGTGGYGYPACIHCPPARYSDDAVFAHLQGTVQLRVVIGPEGHADMISVEKALPCGLDQQAIEVVKSWRFRPATGPDGKPAAVLQPVEVTFHLY